MPSEQAIQTLIFALNAGLICLIVSDRLRLPSLLFFLLAGIGLGPFGANLILPKSLGDLLPVIIELGVVIIMFEGAMTLSIPQIKATSRVIQRILTIGFLINIVGATLIGHFLLDLSWGISLVLAILISVTGPTVITPILRKVPLKKPIGSVLHSESILLEPIIVITSLLVVEFIISQESFGQNLWGSALKFLKSFSVGGLIGFASAYLILFWLKRASSKTNPMRNIVIVALALLVFELSNFLVQDSGLVAVVACGIVLGQSRLEAFYEIKQFKELMTRILIALLFILLSAKLPLDEFLRFSPQMIIAIALIMLVLRPLNIFASTYKSDLTLPAKIFISLTGPRGIVSASMASLYAIVFTEAEVLEAQNLEIIAYQIIVVTVVTQGLFSGPIASLLGVKEKEKSGYVIVGAHPFAIELAKWIQSKNIDVLVIDSDYYDVLKAKKKGLNARKGDALNQYFMEGVNLEDYGNFLAITSNDEVNTLACQLAKRYFKSDHIFQIDQTLTQQENPFLKSAGGNNVFHGISPILKVLEDLRAHKFKLVALPHDELKIKEECLALFFQQKDTQTIAPIKKWDGQTREGEYFVLCTEASPISEKTSPSS